MNRRCNSCNSCGMPFDSEDQIREYCVYCSNPDGTLKSYDEILNGMIAFFMQSQGIEATAARNMSVELLQTLPLWNKESLKNTLLSSFSLNDTIVLQNRLVMAPMTRCFAPNNIPTEQMSIYYEQRADAGLIISEATMIGPHASGYPNTPGIFTKQQIEEWRKISERIQRRGAKFFLQLWHAGMMSHACYREGLQPISAWSTTPKKNPIPLTQGKLSYGASKAMDRSDMKKIIEEFVSSALNAIEAGCEGIEFHAANGYLLDSFLHYFSNKRTDEYGSTPQNMCRFVLEVIDAVAEKIGGDRLGIRLSPIPIPSMENIEEDVRDQEIYIHLLKELERRKLAYVHISSDDDVNNSGALGIPVSAFVKRHYKGNLVGCGSYTLETGTEAIKRGQFDLLALGRPFIANPNLIEIIKSTTNPSSSLRKYDSAMLAQLA